MTGLSVDTLRAWERRYNVVSPSRSTRGRLYEDRDVQRFIRLRNAVGKGYAIGEVASLPDHELQKLLTVRDEGADAGSPATISPVTERKIKAILAAVEAFDSV